MNHTTPHTEVSDIYDAIQVGEITNVKIGDTINGKYLVVDALGNFTEIEKDKPYFIFTETIRNQSTNHTFNESYVATIPVPLDSRIKHLKTIRIESKMIKLNN